MEETKPSKPDMTPMIDVCFQLIVFFLVSMKFKSLDMKIDACLPKDRGIHVTTVRPQEDPKIVAALKRSGADGVTLVKVAGQQVGDMSPASRRTTLDALERLARTARERAGPAAHTVKGEVSAAPRTPTGDVLHVVDSFVAAGLAEVTFVGTPEPGTPLDRLLDEPGTRGR